MSGKEPSPVSSTFIPEDDESTPRRLRATVSETPPRRRPLASPNGGVAPPVPPRAQSTFMPEDEDIVPRAPSAQSTFLPDDEPPEDDVPRRRKKGG